MGAVAFDTLEFVETLIEAGVTEKQAKAFSIVVRKSYEDADLATKQDITELRHEISALRKQDIAQLHYEISDLRKDVDTKHELLRHEIGDLRKDVDIKHDSLRADMRHQVKELELRLTIKLGTIVVAAASAIPLLFRLLHLS